MTDLQATLERVRAAVLCGDLAALAQLTPEVERHLADTQGMSASELEQISRAARRNMATLAAAMQGIRAATRRLSDLREAATGHRTYGPGGQRSAVGGTQSTLRQRV